ncbi:hypothetical protein [Paraliobacillus sediminis]|uniref:hypothetical protein n=1 Tax=Paraliobacillus sediminis TaxID=1885916 RepID=UPI000E3CB1AD|nr:hypothetical protein [Paraliobacillus sediminis]
MNFFINKFSIISPINKKAFSQEFTSNINLIVGEKDTGKSTLSRAILFTMGCDVRSFDLLKKYPDNIYILEFSIKSDDFLLIRRRLKDGKGKNYFKIVKNRHDNNIYYDTTSFKDKLNEILGIRLVTIGKENVETKLFPNHIFLPFYTDQDYSWQSYLAATFNGVNFIPNIKKILLEYFSGARSNDYYTLQLEKNKVKADFHKVDSLIRGKELIIQENIRNIKIIESIDVEDFKENYKMVLNLYNNIIETEHKIKEELNESIYSKNSLLEMHSKLDVSIETIINKEIEKECPTCNQRVDNNMEHNYRLLLTRENLINEREKIKMHLNEAEKSINESMEQVKTLKVDQNNLEEKLNANTTVVSLIERADSYALSRINIKLKEEIITLEIQRKEYEFKLEEVEERLKKLNERNVSLEYKKLMIQAFNDLNIQFSYKNYYTSNLESVEIGLSGASKVQAFIAQYLTIYEMSLKNKDIIDIPMFIDTFLKDDFNNDEIVKTAQFIFSKLENTFQSFIFISNNEQTLNIIKDYNFNRINLTEPYNFFNSNYEETYEEYFKELEGE